MKHVTLRLPDVRSLLPNKRDRAAHALAAAILVAIVAGVASAMVPGLAAAFAVVSLGTLAIAVAMARFSFVAAPVFIGFGVRIVAVAYHNFVARLPQATDAGVFERRAAEVAQLPLGEHFAQFGTGAAIMPWLAGWVFRLVGPEPLVTQLIMAVFGALLIVETCRLATALRVDTRMVLLVAWVMAFFPQPVIHSALLLREIPFALLLTVAATGLVRWERTRAPQQAVLASVAMIGAIAFHAAAIFLFAAAVVYVALRATTERGAVRVVLGGVSLIAIGVAGWFVFSTEFGAEQLGGSFADIDEAFLEREARPTLGGAAYPEWLRIRGAQDAWKVPLRVGLFLFAPFPWMVETLRQSLGIIDSLVYMVAVILMLRGRHYWRTVGSSASVRTVLVLFIVGAIVFGINVSNYGTAIRHRAKFASLVVVLAVAGVQRIRTPDDAVVSSGGRPVDVAVSRE